jgi:para-aminobenzoate synthetase component 1
MLSPWYVRSRPLHHQTGSAIFSALYGDTSSGAATAEPEPSWQTIATLLESPDQLPPETPQARLARYSICAGPPRVIHDRPQLWTPPVGEILPMLAARLATPQPDTMLLDEQGQPLETPLEPFAGGWLGWLGYDLAWEIEALPTHNRDPLPFPVAFWYEPDTFAVLDHGEQRLWLAATQPAQLDEMEEAIARPPRSRPPQPLPNPWNLPPLKPPTKPLSKRPKNTFALGIFFRRIYRYASPRKPPPIAGPFINICIASIPPPLPATGAPPGAQS